MPEEMMTRGFSGCEIREVDQEKRTATFVAATENGVQTWAGVEYLRMKGAKLGRYRKNPVILDTHNRWAASSVIGKSELSVEGRSLIAKVTFARTTAAEEVWSLVKDGFIRALSVGFIPQKVQRVAEGETYGEGEERVAGPARVVTEWELFEISVVPVPADADALRRGLGVEPSQIADEAVRAFVERIGGMFMSQQTKAADKAPETPAESSEKQASKVTETTELRAARLSTDPPTEAEIEARNIQARRDAIRNLTPPGMEAIAQRCLLENKTVEQTREILLAELTKRSQPAGTTEPAPIEKREESGGKKAGESKLADITDDVLMRSLVG